MQLVDELSKNNKVWYTRDAKVGDLGHTFVLSSEQRKREEKRDQDMAHMKTQIGMLTKHIVSKSKKVNVVEQPNIYEYQDIDLDEDTNYQGNEGGLWSYNSGNECYKFGNIGRNYLREGQYDRTTNREHGNLQNIDGYKNDHSGVYVPRVLETRQVVVPPRLS